MPQKYIKYSDPMQDGRRKILPSMYPEIREQYKVLKSTRKVATMFNCSRRLIMFIIHPERLKQMQEHKKKIKAHLKYYNKEQHTKHIAKYRAKKRKLKLTK